MASLAAIAASLILSAAGASETVRNAPLVAVVVIGGIPLVWEIAKDLIARNPGADLLAALAIVTAVLLDEWLVAAIIVLMLSGGEALEEAATARASRVLEALAKRAPTLAHRLVDGGNGRTEDIPVSEIRVGDHLLVLPHEVCPVDGEVVSGRGTMDESYLTGEPYVITKSVGSKVLSGAINGEDALVIRAAKTAADSRYAQIVGVLEEAEANRPRMRRMADRLGAWYTVVALAMGILGWVVSSDPERFLSVMVIATPCPLLIAVPVAIVGAISLAARSAIIIKDPGVLERIPKATIMMFDKTGTLTYGRPTLTTIDVGAGFERAEVLRLSGALERYSRHPLASAIVDAATEELGPDFAADVERLAEVLDSPHGDGREVRITSRRVAEELLGPGASSLPPRRAGMESILIIDDRYAATFQFRDEPRLGSAEFISHLGPRHGVTRTMLISGDRASEVEYLAERVGIEEVHAEASPEEKLEIVRRENEKGTTLFLGDGINDAPAMAAAHIGVAFGRESDITSEAAGAVVLDSSLERLDELLHIGERMRRIALQSAVGGIALSMIGMVLAVMGMLPPLLGAIAQEAIDLLAILNAARVVAVRRPLADYHEFVAPAPRPVPEAV